MKHLIFLNSHPIQYFAPLYKSISENTDINLTVWYCSDESIKGKLDKGFGQKVKWNIPLLDGYAFLFFKNYSFVPSIFNGFFGLINPGVILKLFKIPKSTIIIHGWSYSTHIMTIIIGKICGHTICLRGENPLSQEKTKPKFVTIIKHLYLRFIFLFVDYFLFIGTDNKLFYQYLGIKNSRLIFCPYCVDNERFREICVNTTKIDARRALKLPLDKKIIMYSGKYMQKKRPLDLLNAFKNIEDKNTILVFVGDGILKEQMLERIRDYKLTERIILTGFVNQNEIPLYYKSSDIFVMCSGPGETWGLSVNEAMNFGIPVLVSATCGCAIDLVEDGRNGSIFETGNIYQLSNLINVYLHISENTKKECEIFSFSKLDQFSYFNVICSIKSLIK